MDGSTSVKRDYFKIKTNELNSSPNYLSTIGWIVLSLIPKVPDGSAAPSEIWYAKLYYKIKSEKKKQIKLKKIFLEKRGDIDSDKYSVQKLIKNWP